MTIRDAVGWLQAADEACKFFVSFHYRGIIRVALDALEWGSAASKLALARAYDLQACMHRRRVVRNPHMFGVIDARVLGFCAAVLRATVEEEQGPDLTAENARLREALNDAQARLVERDGMVDRAIGLAEHFEDEGKRLRERLAIFEAAEERKRQMAAVEREAALLLDADRWDDAEKAIEAMAAQFGEDEPDVVRLRVLLHFVHEPPAQDNRATTGHVHELGSCGHCDGEGGQ